MDKPKDFKQTLNLPKTDFPIHPNHAIEDAKMLERWEQGKIYEKSFEQNKGSEKYILHDGPPYANGHIHLGHAYNKILKDIVTKSHRMAGHQVPVTPGWDCHGLPIELKVTQEQPELSQDREQLMSACRQYAERWIDIQRAEFKKLGVLMDWDRPYLTMDPSYEAEIIRSFGTFVAKGAVERKNKAVAWCFSCATTLASAEIEYRERKDPSIFVAFPLAEPFDGHSVSLAVWTTTPWTLPLNRAVALHPSASYELVRIGDRYLIAGAGRAESLAKLMGQEFETLRTFSAQELAGYRVRHPFITDLTVPIIFDPHVGLEEGTACVHTAPGCGMSDYELGVKHGLEIFSPIDAHGRYTKGIVPTELEGKSVTEGQGWVITRCVERGALLHKGSLMHSYPHCWRCRNGLIFRATVQWFINLDKEHMKERALAALNTIKFIPEQGKNFLKATIENRWEWCLSRQRVWGVPIPALICTSCDYAYCTKEFVEQIAARVAEEGIEYWARASLEEVLALVVRPYPSIHPSSPLAPSDTQDERALDLSAEASQAGRRGLAKGEGSERTELNGENSLSCPNCSSKNFRKELDILDVWFESGVSHAAVLSANPDLAFPADIYLEGVDQYRAWFQSSLLTALMLEGSAPMKLIMSHGFTVDERGHKMSKSLGNVIAPDELIKRFGTDGLRLWVASIGHDRDAVVSERVITTVAEVYRKIRNTCRFMLQNLYDFDHERDAVPLDQLSLIDARALIVLADMHDRSLGYYREYHYTALFHELATYCSTTLSAGYLDWIKDRLYVERADGLKRRSAQTVLYHILKSLTHLMAPVLSFTAEHLSDYYDSGKEKSIHLEPFNNLRALAPLRDRVDLSDDLWDHIATLRSALLKCIEGQRETGVIKHPLEAALEIFIDPALFERDSLLAKTLTPELIKELCVVSSVRIEITEKAPANSDPTSIPGISIRASQAPGLKCPRCWHYDEHPNEWGLCQRCALLV